MPLRRKIVVQIMSEQRSFFITKVIYFYIRRLKDQKSEIQKVIEYLQNDGYN